MEIKRIKDRTFYLKGRKEAVIVNPESMEVIKQYKSRVLLHTDKSKSFLFSDERLVIAGEGEYEVGGVEIVGINAGGGGVAYTINMDGLMVGIVGELGGDYEQEVGKIEAVDVLLIELSDKVEATGVMDLAKKWGANFVIPMGRVGERTMEKFLDLADREGIEPVEVLKIERDELPDGLEIVALR